MRTARGAAAAIYGAEIACIAAIGEDGLAVALATGEIVVEGGPFDGRRYRADTGAQCITAHGRDRDRTLCRERLGDERSADWQRDLLERNAIGQHLAHRSGKRDVQHACRRSRLAGRPCGRWPRDWSSPRPGSTSSSRIDPAASGKAADAPCRPAGLSRPDRAGCGWLLAGAVRAAQPARRVRAARAGLPQAHDGRGAAAVLGGAETAGPAAASTSRCRAAA